MAKIPLERTIGATYSFMFANILSVLGIVWLPYLLLGAVAIGLVVAVLPAFHGIDFSANADIASDPARMIRLGMQAGSAIFVFALAAILFRSMAVVGVMRKALGQHPAPVFIHFSLGAPVWRLIGATILAALVILAMGVIAGLAVALIATAGAKFAPAADPFLIGVTVFAVVLWIIYAAVRLSFFLPAVVVAENRISLGRAWQLGGGNFWRIIILVLAVTVPVMLAGSLIANVVLDQTWLVTIQQMSVSGQEIPPQQFFHIIADQFRRAWPEYLVYELIYLALLAALTTGAVANAYKGVTEAESAA